MPIAAAVAILMGGGALFAQGAGQAPCGAPAMPTPECAAIHAAEFAQLDAPDAPNAPEAPGPRRRHLEQFRMLKLLELLDLDREQEMEFLVDFKALREKQLLLQRERELVVEFLATGLREDTLKGNQITQRVQRVMELRREYALASEKFLERVMGILTPEQVGRLVVFEERFEFELLDQVRSFHERRGMPGAKRGLRQQDSDSD